MFDALLDFIFPPHCPACDAYVERSGEWCDDCLAAATRPHRIALDEGARQYIDAAYALGLYRESPLRSLIIELKYNGRRDRLAYIKTFIYDALKKSLADGTLISDIIAKCDVAVPVPLHRSKEKKRGFNQTELIFKGALIGMGLSWSRAIERVRETVPQHGLDVEARRRNLDGAFSAADTSSIVDARVLLVDDIFTTGTTATSCAHVLMKAGAQSVTVMTLASDHG